MSESETIAPEGTEPTANPVEEQAREQGWKPKDEFEGDDHQWVDAGEFVRRGELFKKIEAVSKTAKNAEKVLAQFKDHYAKVKQTEFANALAQLKAEAKAARRDGDFDREDAIADRIEAVTKEAELTKKEIGEAIVPVEVHPDVAAWVDKNKWYNEDLPMKAYADAVAQKLNKQGIAGPELLKGIDKEVREAFPNKFRNTNRDRPGDTEVSSNRGTSRKTDSFELSAVETKIMQNFVRDKVMTKEEYIADLKKIRGIK